MSAVDKTVRCGPVLLIVPDPSFNHAAGDTVELYIRPEDVRLQLLSNGHAASACLDGRVTSLTFLGPVTRVGLATDVGPLLADVSSAVALNLAADTPVAVRLDSTSLRTITASDAWRRAPRLLRAPGPYRRLPSLVGSCRDRRRSPDHRRAGPTNPESRPVASLFWRVLGAFCLACRRLFRAQDAGHGTCRAAGPVDAHDLHRRPGQMFTRYAAAFASTARMREGAQAGFWSSPGFAISPSGSCPAFSSPAMSSPLSPSSPPMCSQRVFMAPWGRALAVIVLLLARVHHRLGDRLPRLCRRVLCGRALLLSRHALQETPRRWLVSRRGALTLGSARTASGSCLASTTLFVYGLVCLARSGTGSSKTSSSCGHDRRGRRRFC